jgi:hypothetical protein
MRKKERERKREGEREREREREKAKEKGQWQEWNERRGRPTRYLFLKFSGSRSGGPFVNK